MDFENYKLSYVYRYSEDSFTQDEYVKFFDKISQILKQINDKIDTLYTHKNFEMMLIHFKKIISLIEYIKKDHRINYQLIQLNISYINDLSN